ncbi:MAG: endonuclease III [Armatimonadetes bacterium]|nr:endonuclease III [Armatimonadota bacterium]
MNDQTYKRDKARRIHDLLAEAYGIPEGSPEEDLLGSLVATILSQNTSDANSHRAYESLKAAFPAWEAVRQAPVKAVADAIRSGGLADMKAARIQSILNAIRQERGGLDLSFLREMADEEVRAYLTAFEGVGPKTAACVLMFGMLRPVLPVDTHVHRVSRRLGLIGPKVSAEEAHRLLPELLEPEMIYAFHVNLVRHGRRVCRAQKPRCLACPLRRDCDSFNRGYLTQ